MFETSHASLDVLETLGERSFVAAMLRFEAALARAQAKAGLIPETAASSIIDTCKVDLFDVAQILRESRRAGGVAAPLVASLRETVGLFNQEAAACVHFACSDRSVIETALALVTRDVLNRVQADVSRGVAALLTLAQQHASVPMLTRSGLQPVSVSSFGLKCAGWASPLVSSLQRLRRAAGRTLTVQLGASPGALSLLNQREGELTGLMAHELALGAPKLPGQAPREEWTALACELGLLTGSLGKMAQDLALMSQLEVGEVTEPLKSATKATSSVSQRRPAGALMVALECAHHAPQRVAALLAGMIREDESVADAWPVPWADWSQLLISAHGCAQALAQILPILQVHPERMRAHLDGLRAQFPKDAAPGFDPALALEAGQITRQQVQLMHSELRSLQAGTAAG